MEDGEAEPQQACQLWLLMELVRELQAPTQKATTTQEIYSRETEEEQPQMEVTETAAEPEAEKEEADQIDRAHSWRARIKRKTCGTAPTSSLDQRVYQDFPSQYLQTN